MRDIIEHRICPEKLGASSVKTADERHEQPDGHYKAESRENCGDPSYPGSHVNAKLP